MSVSQSIINLVNLLSQNVALVILSQQYLLKNILVQPSIITYTWVHKYHDADLHHLSCSNILYCYYGSTTR